MWSAGCLLHLLLLGSNGFDDTDSSLLRQSIVSGLDIAAFKRKASASHLSGYAQDLLLRLLCRQPNQRPTATQALQHGWFRSLARKTSSVSGLSSGQATPCPIPLTSLRRGSLCHTTDNLRDYGTERAREQRDLLLEGHRRLAQALDNNSNGGVPDE